MRLKPGTRLGSYEIVSALGRGGMGEVYRASDAKLGREVAIKVLSADLSADPKLVRRFEQEARAASALNHPNITTIYEIGQTDATAYIVMELVQGRTLRDLLASGALSTKRLLAIATQVADALAKAHAAGIVHRDLKPENLMLTSDGVAKILDFGLAKLVQSESALEGASEASTLARGTEPGVILGTVGYMSPEQASGRPVAFHADQFSFGVVLYEMATGRRPFQRGTAVETLSAIIREEPERMGALNAGVPAPLRWVVERCLAKDPDERYACTRDLAQELRTLQDHLFDLSAGSLATETHRSATTRRLASAALAALLVLVAGAFLLGRSQSRPQPAFRQLTFRHGHIRGARLAADGRTVVYGAAWTAEAPELYLIRPEGPQSGALGLRDAGIFSISSQGEMAVALGCRLNWGECIGTLARVPLTGGAPREIMKDVHGADWAPDGKTLAAVAFAGGAYRLRYPLERVLYDAPGWITYARVSPAGDLVAFLDHPVLGDLSGSVCLVEPSGRKRTLSSGWKSLQGLAWSANGKEVWFTGSRVSKGGSLALQAVTLSGAERVVFSSPGTLELHDISRDGERVLLVRGNTRGGIVSLAPGAEKERDLSWFDYSTVADLSADGKTLLFYEWGEGVGGNPTVYLRRTDGSDSVRLGEGRPLALSPDGRWALAVQQSSPPELVLLPTGPGEVKRLPRAAITEYLDWGAWSPDSRHVFFAAAESAEVRRTYVQDVEGGPPRPATDEGLVATLLSPDGRSLAAVDRYGEYYICALAGGEPRALEGYVDGDVLLRWSADGRSLFVRDAGNLSLRIHRLELSTGRRELWKELAAPDPAVLIDIGSDPGQVRLTPDGRSYAYTYWSAAGELYLAQGLR